jgi:hypothetical protein
VRDGSAAPGRRGAPAAGATRDDARPSAPALAPPAVRATAIGAGLFHTCALVEDGAVACWGQNVDGVVDGSDDAGRVFGPVRVAGVEGALSVHVARDKSCVGHGPESRLTCWGRGAIGRDYGPGARPLTRPLGAAALAVGANHACGRDDVGRVRCLGRNDYGQRASTLGRYVATGRANEVEDLDDVRSVALGRSHTY